MPQPLLNERPPSAGHDHSSAVPGRYLTDGVHLYRELDGPRGESSRMAVLEDCQSLDVIIARPDELQRLRRVVAAGDSGSVAVPGTGLPADRLWHVCGNPNGA